MVACGLVLAMTPIHAGTIFEDPLDGGAVAGWTVAPGTFEKTPDGSTAYLLVKGSPKAPMPMAGDESWKNYRLTVEILPAGEKGFLGLDFNVRKSDGCGCNLHFSLSKRETLSLQTMRYCGAGTESWKLWPVSQRQIPFPNGQWIRLRIDAGEEVANVYVNDDAKPVFTIYDLPSSAGGVRFWSSFGGSGYYRRLRIVTLPSGSVKPVLEDMWAAVAGKNILRNWCVSKLLPADAAQGTLPAEIREGKPVETDRRGVVNLGVVLPKYGRNTAFAETVVHSDRDVTRRAWVTYTDRFTLYCNGQEVFRGPDRHWFSPDREKYGSSRLIPDQFEVQLPLKAGENRLVVRSEALEQFGWGFWMRLD
jgi:hypothetical protein